MKKIAILTTTLAEDDFTDWHYNEKRAINDLGCQCDLLKNGNFKVLYDKRNVTLFYEQKPFDVDEYGLLINQMSLSLGHTADYYIVHVFEEHGIPTYNKIESILQAKNKLHTISMLCHKNIYVPKTFVVRQREDIAFVMSHITNAPYIIKEVYGSGGARVLIAESKKAIHAIFDYVWLKERNTILLIQEYVESNNNDGSDIRALLIDGAFVSAMRRIPTALDFRANVKIGGTFEAIELSESEKQLCVNIATDFDLKVCGIDFIRTKVGPCILEVNSNPTLSALPLVAKKQGIDVFKIFAKYCLKYVK